MSNDEMDDGSLLTQPLSISDLVKDGTQFQINTNFQDNLPNDMLDDLNLIGSDDEDESSEVMLSPWEQTFDELRQRMMKIDDNIYKRITVKGDSKVGVVPDRARVIIQYNAYWEKEPAPFDSSYLRGQAHMFHCGRNEVLEGLEAAVKTMFKGEEAQFVISYKLLFRELGCPPRIKPKSDGLFIVKLVDFIDIGDEYAIESLSDEDKNKFSIVLEKAKDVHLKALDFFKTGNIRGATKLFHKAVTALESSRLSNEEEQIEQTKFLVKLYTNLAVCYNKMNQPQKACCMCNEIKRLTDISKNCKVLFQQGRALFMIGEYPAARSKLFKAQMLEPNNEEISRELKLLDKRYEQYKSSERQIWQKAMGLIKPENNESKVDDQFDKFKEASRKLLKEFKEKDGASEISMPDGLCPNEIRCIEELVNELDLHLRVIGIGNMQNFVISKKPQNTAS